MGHTSSIFDSVPLEVQKLNGFDLSHIACGTATCGTLTPVLCKLLPQGSKFSLGVAMNVELPPLATSFFGRIDACIEVFVVPCAVLYGGWKQFISGAKMDIPASQSSLEHAGKNVPGRGLSSDIIPSDVLKASYDLPVINLLSDWCVARLNQLKEDSVLSYLGANPTGDWDRDSDDVFINMLPLLAYHKIADVYYRNTNTTRSWFAVNPNASTSNYNAKNVSLVWHSFYSEAVAATSPIFSVSGELTFPDGVDIFTLRQRPYSRDYFTAGSVDPVGDNPIYLQTVDSQLSIPSLRALNSLTKFVELNNFSSTYRDVMRANFGTVPGDAELDEPIYVGRCVVPVYQKSVYQQGSDGAASNKNPFANDGTLGARGAHGSMSGEGSICSNFNVKSFSYVMGIFSLVPHTMYNYGICREFSRRSRVDFPFPMLQSVGMDAVYSSEVYFSGLLAPLKADVFSYVPRYSFEKYINDHANGKLLPGKELASFALQRVFDGQPSFNTEFVTIPRNALDAVFAAESSISGFSCWYEIYFKFHAVMPFAQYSIPTLGDLKDTRTIRVSQGGSRL